jgi:hypothetical protein
MKTLDIELYKPNRENWEKSLLYAKNMVNENNTKLVFHCFWRVPKDFGRKQVAVLKSIIVNHVNLDIEINLWSNVDLSDNLYFQEVSKFVVLKKWDIHEEIKGTIIENCQYLNSINDDFCWLEGDVFRLLILHKYGGFYLDMDVLVLRDMSPLNNLEFLYQWGTSGFNAEPTMTMNGAIMRLNKDSVLSTEFLQKILITPPSPNTTSWGNSLYSSVSDILALPGIWFNSEWGFEGTVYGPFENKGTVELFEGAYTWHWHNKWDDIIEEGSKFHVLEKLIDSKMKLL